MTSHLPNGSEWLPKPTVEYFRDESGRIESAYISLRDTRYTRAVQPSEQHLVFLYVGADDVPIGIRLLEPVGDVVGTKILRQLLESPGPKENVNHTFEPMTLEQTDELIHTMRDASKQLEGAAAR